MTTFRSVPPTRNRCGRLHAPRSFAFPVVSQTYMAPWLCSTFVTSLSASLNTLIWEPWRNRMRLWSSHFRDVIGSFGSALLLEKWPAGIAMPLESSAASSGSGVSKSEGQQFVFIQFSYTRRAPSAYPTATLFSPREKEGLYLIPKICRRSLWPKVFGYATWFTGYKTVEPPALWKMVPPVVSSAFAAPSKPWPLVESNPDSPGVTVPPERLICDRSFCERSTWPAVFRLTENWW
mmetsp:Transcript_28232/g.71662  ORF Transcript_28232/g.71662 Transcript_28232/m.71662 type:complete len:235 (+) Transcript_28232:1696-2400(+)